MSIAWGRRIPFCPKCKRSSHRIMLTYDGETVAVFTGEEGDPEEFLGRPHVYYVCLQCMKIY